MPLLLSICNALNALPIANTYVIDFSRTHEFEPFGMLLLSAAIRRLAERGIKDNHRPVIIISGKSLSIPGHRYAHRFGFWWSIGDESASPIVEKTGSFTSVPITKISYAGIFEDAGLYDPFRDDMVTKSAAALTTTLTGHTNDQPIWLALNYCFRELLQNSFEHGHTDSVWIAGAANPRQDEVQIAVVDGGRGIRESLADNPTQRYSADSYAVQAAIRLGVSRNAKVVENAYHRSKWSNGFPIQTPRRDDNCGCGLTVACFMAKDVGQFAVVSGAASVAYFGRTEIRSSTTHKGTAVRIVLRPSRLPGLLERVGLKPDGTIVSGPLMSASLRLRMRANSKEGQ